jgi:hypothetical protein
MEWWWQHSQVRSKLWLLCLDLEHVKRAQSRNSPNICAAWQLRTSLQSFCFYFLISPAHVLRHHRLTSEALRRGAIASSRWAIMQACTTVGMKVSLHLV